MGLYYENDTELRASLDIDFNKKNRVTAVHFASLEAIANTPHSPRYTNIIHDNAENSNTASKNSSKILRKSVTADASPMQLAKLMPVLKATVQKSIGVARHDNRYFFRSLRKNTQKKNRKKHW